jgi:hypothetical protein
VRRTAVFVVLALCLSATFAQTDQKLMVRCTYINGFGTYITDLTIDLAAQTMSETQSTPNPGGSPTVSHYQGRVTQVTDQEIRMDLPSQGSDLSLVLNRYTGDLTTTRGSVSAVSPCQRQQRQF